MMEYAILLTDIILLMYVKKEDLIKTYNLTMLNLMEFCNLFLPIPQQLSFFVSYNKKASLRELATP